MTPEAQAIKDIIVQVKPELMWILLQTSVVAISILVLHNLLKTLAAYISFRSNRDISKNVKIIFKGREAIITHFSIRFIFLRFKDNGNEMIIPMSRWEIHEWELIKNGNK